MFRRAAGSLDLDGTYLYARCLWSLVNTLLRFLASVNRRGRVRSERKVFMTREEEKFITVVQSDPKLGAAAAALIANLFRAHAGLCQLTLAQRLRLVSLATIHNIHHLRVPTQ